MTQLRLLSVRFMILSVVLLAMLSGAAEPPSSGGSNAIQLTTISLTDQHNQPHVFAFPQPGVSILTVADRKGSEQIEAWVRAITTRYPTHLPVEGVADVSSAPAPLRPFIRKRFRDAFAHPVMLDWKGSVVKQLRAAPDVASVYAVNTNGVVLRQFFGAANVTNLAELFAVLDANGATAATNVTTAKGAAAP
jgi:hypothetical protein